jgi:hypothetical protein
MEVSGYLHTLAASAPGKNPGTQRAASRMGPRDGLDIYEKRKASCLYWDLNPGLSSL